MKVEITYRIALQDSGSPLSLWIPVPANTGYQSVLSRRHEGNYAQAGFFSDPLYGAPALYARWQEGADSKVLSVTIEVETRERRGAAPQGGGAAGRATGRCQALSRSDSAYSHRWDRQAAGRGDRCGRQKSPR